MRIAIVGAGLSGLMAGRALAVAGHEVVLLDKGRSPGGRLATRRIGEARLDHGAQFFTVRSETFRAHVDSWLEAGVVREWCRGFGAGGDGFSRYIAPGGMNAVAKYLAAGLEVRCSTLVFAVHPGDGAWTVAIDDGTSLQADALVVTCPLPQSFSLLVSAHVTLPESLVRTDYDRTLALLAVLDRPGAVPPPGGVQHPDDTFSFIGDNAAKGISPVPALTFHANPAWSLEHWDDEPDHAHALLREAAAPWLGHARIVESQLKRWRFATPRSQWPDRCWSARPGDGSGAVAPLALAGDAFTGPKIEGAALSGLAAAEALVLALR